ncbi:O-methyltransferase [Glycomyces algeriensis]|uniref:O-methyltransferase n=1 Tax=Glycomyces algeriensis TaxID=256037 RepID=A0A9W6G8Y9_9ACTN|nr:O-methyltransferase [Glycomyces algeriensis]MDA1364968.1 O-methyltransferase [Glycomyces algeriensis]MDR7349971.1 putative O-methyltransferase YrrM [Glycomyces algeriensis]GLI42681.1 O-methyltransferase [Glycomyces algeriensis]
MGQGQWTEVDAFLSSLLVGEDEALAEAHTAAQRAGLPPISVSAAQGKLLYLLAKTLGAKRVLEIGTLGGYSAIWMARALPKDGHLVSLEYSPRHAEVASGNIARAGLVGIVEIRVGAAADTLPKLAAEGGEPFDMVFIDADKGGYPDYLDWSLQLTRPGGLIVADNVVRGGAVADGLSRDPNVQGVRSYLEKVAADPRLEGTVMQTVGVKGYDGLSIARVVG